MDARQVLARLRRGEILSDEEIGWFARGLATGEVDDAQAGAFAMAFCLEPRTEAERVALTLAMRDSGEVLDWDLPGPVLDKHSTGGIGDCVSLVLAPALAALGPLSQWFRAGGWVIPAARSTSWKRSPA